MTATVTQGFAYASSVDGALGGNGRVNVTFSVDNHVASWTSPDIGAAGSFLLQDPTSNLYYAFSDLPLRIGDTLSYAGQSIDTFTPPCFVAGTEVATVAGDVAVEHLRIGDNVITAGRSGPPHRPIVWIGRRRVDPRHLVHQAARPVRIRKGAFGPGMPDRDLLLSADHAVFVDGVLIPAHLLVNGATIVAETMMRPFTYFHIELDRHDLLMAGGLAVESYLDTGNRAAFSNAGKLVRLGADFAPKKWGEDACAALLTDGPALVAVRQRLHARALGDGHVLCGDAGLLLGTAGGTRAFARSMAGTFVAPLVRGAPAIRLLSATGVPAETDPSSNDPRRLGVRIDAMWLHANGSRHPIDLRHRSLQSGFHPTEADGRRRWRWTAGNAVVLPPWQGEFDAIELQIGAVQPRWQRVEDATTAPEAAPRPARKFS